MWSSVGPIPLHILSAELHVLGLYQDGVSRSNGRVFVEVVERANEEIAEFAAVTVLGKSSECGMCMAPIVTKATRSSFTMESLSITYLRKSSYVMKK